MMFVLAWISANGPLSLKGKYFVAEGEAYKTLPAEYRSFSFYAKSDREIRVTLRFWKDGEYWQKVLKYNPGEHRIEINLNRVEDPEHIPTRGIGPFPTVILVESEGKVYLSEVEF
jgi:hypothetical protein